MQGPENYKALQGCPCSLVALRRQICRLLLKHCARRGCMHVLELNPEVKRGAATAARCT